MIFDRIEWDEANLDHATVRLTATEIEQVISNADRWTQHRDIADRVMFRSVTNGERRCVVIAQRVRDGMRPITGWDDE